MFFKIKIENFGLNKIMLFFLIEDKVYKDGKEQTCWVEKIESFVRSKCYLKDIWKDRKKLILIICKNFEIVDPIFIHDLLFYKKV